MSSEPETTDRTWSIRNLPRLAVEGAIGNAAWALLALAAVVIAALLKGEVAAWIFAVVLVVTLGLASVISTTLLRRADRMQGERDEARRQARDANQRAVQIEEASEAERRELREQVAAATGGERAVSTRMQSVARQVDALASTPVGYAYGPEPSQVDLFVSLIQDMKRLAPAEDPIITQLLQTWDLPLREHNTASWESALQVLKARALSLGAEEALGQQR